MWDSIWYLGFPMFAVSVFGAPYKKDHFSNDSEYNAEQFDVIYDQRQNGSDNIKLSIDGLSLIWSPNTLLAAAALLEPALYGEYPDTNIDVILGPEGSKPEKKLDVRPEPEKMQNQNSDQPKDNSRDDPTVLIIDGNQVTGEKVGNTLGSKRKFRLPGFIRPFLRKRSSISSHSRSNLTKS